MVGRDYRASDRRVAWLMAVTAAIAVYALGVAWTGGFDARIAGVRLRSHSWIRPAMVAAAGVTLLIRIARPQIAAISSVAILHPAKSGASRRPLAGIFVRDRLPAMAFILAAQHSGSIRCYAGRPTLRWDLLGAGHLDEVLAALRAQGFDPFLVVDGGEIEAFRRASTRSNSGACR